MTELVLLSILIEEYKITNKVEYLPKSFDYNSLEEKIIILKQALEENKKIEDVHIDRETIMR